MLEVNNNIPELCDDFVSYLNFVMGGGGPGGLPLSLQLLAAWAHHAGIVYNTVDWYVSWTAIPTDQIQPIVVCSMMADSPATHYLLTHSGRTHRASHRFICVHGREELG